MATEERVQGTNVVVRGVMSVAAWAVLCSSALLPNLPTAQEAASLAPSYRAQRQTQVDNALTYVRVRSGLPLPKEPISVHAAALPTAVGGNFTPLRPGRPDAQLQVLVDRDRALSRWPSVLRHELTHALVFARFGRLPRPIDEGYATWVADGGLDAGGQVDLLCVTPGVQAFPFNGPLEFEAYKLSALPFQLAEREGGPAAATALLERFKDVHWTPASWLGQVTLSCTALVRLRAREARLEDAPPTP